jgi:hypothetical protein
MKFIRRPDLDKVTRAEITAQAFLAQGIYGEITRLARCYRVSRLLFTPCCGNSRTGMRRRVPPCRRRRAGPWLAKRATGDE